MRVPTIRSFCKAVAFLAVVTIVCPRAWGEVVHVDGFEMHYEVIGQGEPLLLLHGFTGAGENWNPIAADFSEQFQLVIPDLRGHGASTNPGGEFTHRQSALDVYALLDHLGLERVKAMGISTGGMTLLHMATQKPQRIEAMVLIGATIYFPEQAREIMRNTSPTSVPEERMQALRELHQRGEGQVASLLNQFNAFKDSYDDMNFTEPYLTTIHARTLIIHGDRDQFFPVEIARQMYEGIPNSYLWIVPNGGHIPIFGRIQEHFVETSKMFLRDRWHDGRAQPSD